MGECPASAQLLAELPRSVTPPPLIKPRRLLSNCANRPAGKVGPPPPSPWRIIFASADHGMAPPYLPPTAIARLLIDPRCIGGALFFTVLSTGQNLIVGEQNVPARWFPPPVRRPKCEPPFPPTTMALDIRTPPPPRVPQPLEHLTLRRPAFWPANATRDSLCSCEIGTARFNPPRRDPPSLLAWLSPSPRRPPPPLKTAR